MADKLYDRLTELTSSAFTNTDVFGEVITHWPGDNRDRERKFDGCFFLDGEQGTNEIFGDGAAVGQSTKGESERRTGILECDRAEDIRPGDSFVIQNQLWKYYRFIGRDKAMQAIRLVRPEKRISRRPHIRPTHISSGK